MKYEINLGKNALEDLFKDEKGRKTQEIVPMDIKELKPYAEQPFKVLLDNSMDELCASIEQYGVLSPIIVRPHSEGGYEVLSGHRRMKACELLGIEEVPVVVKELSDTEVMELALIENLQREDLNPIEEAAGYKYLMDNFDLTQEQVAERCGKSRSAVANALRLLDLTPSETEQLKSGKIS